MVTIDPTARVSKHAILEEGVEVGPYAIIGEGTKIGAHASIGPFAVLEGRVEIGAHCVIGPHTIIGAPPQDLSYRGEETAVVIGEGTTIREFVTIHRATGEGKTTQIGRACFIMAYCHIAHNCSIGDGVVMANGAMLCGHVIIEDWATLSGLLGIHQFVHLGRLCMVGGLAKVTMDIPPYTLADGHPARIYGLNRVGLKRRGFSPEKREAIKKIYTFLYRSGLPLRKALEELPKTGYDMALVEEIIAFFARSKRGVTRWTKGMEDVREDASFDG
ncbi:MAG: acyl-ACP--UDP-N-acetylglucosamine O-acyltransferase [Atribacterota bacterium]